MSCKLTYFAVGGRAFSIRALLAHANFSFEDVRMTFDDWPAFKPETPMGSMPIWEEDGFQMVNAKAILRMLGIRLGYYTEDPNVAYKIDSLVEYLDGLADIHSGYILPSIQSGTFDESKGRDYIAAVWDKMLPILEARLEKHGQDWIGGTETISIVDFKVGQLLYGATSMNPECKMPPLLKSDISNKIKMNPKFSAWYQRFTTAMQPFIDTQQNTPV